MQNRRVLILLILVVVVGGGLAVLALMNGGGGGGTNTTPGAPTAGPGGPAVGESTPSGTVAPDLFVKIVVALQAMPRGMTIPENGVTLKPWPVDALPVYREENLDDVIGKIARTDLYPDQPVLSTQIVEDLNKIAKKGSDAALFMPPGLVGVTIPIDRLTAVAYAPKTGDYVDVVLSFLFVDVDEQFQSRLPNKLTLTTVKQDGTLEFKAGLEGRVEPSGDFPYPVVVGPSEQQRPRLVTQRTVQSAFVLYVGTFPPDGDILGRRPSPTPLPPPGPGTPTVTPQIATVTATPQPLDMITLAVEPQDAVALVWAIDARLPMTLLLRSANDQSKTTTAPVTLEYFINTYNVPQPPKLPYSLEPAIRSIRRLIIGNEVSFLTTSSAPTTGGGTGGGQ